MDGGGVRLKAASSSNGGRTRVGKYELGRTLGEGNFAKVKFARNSETGENVAIKILDKEKVLKHKMISQIKREISTMKLIRHPNVIRMIEVMASKTKIYIVLEFVTGGELFDKIVSRGRMKEDETRKYFQQLINAVDYCHSRGVFHRDLKPENLLLDANGVLKVSDFGLSALPQQVREDGLLHTTCGTPNYVAPEVINNKGYDGAKADLWSCGVILFVLMAGYLPFEDSNLVALYKKAILRSFYHQIHKADFTCPPWFSTNAKKLIKRILDPNPSTRITIPEVIENEWFRKGYKPPTFEQADISLDDVDAIFNETGVSKVHLGISNPTFKHDLHNALGIQDSGSLVVERKEEGSKSPLTMNAFELISKSQGLNLSSLFEKQMGIVKRETRFTSNRPAKEILSKIEETATPLGFDVKKNNYKMKLQGEKTGRKGHLSVATEIYEVAPSLYMVELRKAGGDTLEFHKFYKSLKTGLKDIVWKHEEDPDEGETGL
ncbi:CBL-interacting serine/threonine-protein kinase 23-like isoform X1 [Cucumis melo var. makuwa]|uniref:non-specific serine/threonine protein kinase n=1 Tax=Cucumis melo var. makuwa TaxID=1194695 RepID=A0A5A7UKE7_CUCMM|nr:CBL-interacting serine/threonine-protein kinase 23-like isoform X1 [Cucumis melo var. makuwa]